MYTRVKSTKTKPCPAYVKIGASSDVTFFQKKIVYFSYVFKLAIFHSILLPLANIFFTYVSGFGGLMSFVPRFS